ncbi:MAG: alkaline phosphatase domain protein [Bacteroidetes bacterium]|jgi:PKD repeat protein|nr:alkaline phosphatase domain protein [Bacteroidota bacterium]
MKQIIILSFFFVTVSLKIWGQPCAAFVTPTTAIVSCTAGAGGYVATFSAVSTSSATTVRHDWYHPYNPWTPFYTSTSFTSSYSGALVPGTYTVVTTHTSIPCVITNTFGVGGNGFPTFIPTSTTTFTLGCAPLNQTSLCITNAITSSSLSAPQFFFAPPSLTFAVPYSSISFGAQSCTTTNTPGIWKLVVRDSMNGCQSVFPATIIQNTATPHLSTSFATQTLSCTSPTILATGNSTTTSAYISWIVPSGPPVNTQTVLVGPPTGPPTSSSSSTYGTYTVVATNTLNGCTTGSAIPFYQNFSGVTTAAFTHTVGLNGFVGFNNITTGSVMICNWNFGDGFVATGNPMSHTYANAGAYNVQLTVNDSGSSCLKTTTLSVNVTSAPCSANSNFTVVPTGTAQYWNVIPAYPWNITNALWNWGDGSTSNNLYSSHTYSTAGTYTLCLTATVSCGAISTTCNSYFINKGDNNMVMVNVNVVPPSPVTVGIRDSESENLIYAVYPNPNNGQFHVRVNGLKDGDAFIGLFNVVGELVYHTNGTVSNGELNKEINVEEIASGIYFMKVSTGEKTYTKKMIISK